MFILIFISAYMFVFHICGEWMVGLLVRMVFHGDELESLKAFLALAAMAMAPLPHLLTIELDLTKRFYWIKRLNI